MRKGVILAGGRGSRLHPLTCVINKHLLPVYDKPMIYYPMSVLMLAGIREITIVSGSESIDLLRNLLGDGSTWGLSIGYRIQPQPSGIADGLKVVADDLRGHPIALILGDNLFYGAGLQKTLEECVMRSDSATIFSYEVSNPSAFGVVTLNAKGQPIDITEKPIAPKSRLAVTGLYFYPPDVFDIVTRLRPSERGELEITDVNRSFMKKERLEVRRLGRGIAWLDGGTTEDLYFSTQLFRVLEERTGLKIACPEEIAWRLGYIDASALRALAELMPLSSYRHYLLALINDTLYL